MIVVYGDKITRFPRNRNKFRGKSVDVAVKLIPSNVPNLRGYQCLPHRVQLAEAHALHARKSVLFLCIHVVSEADADVVVAEVLPRG